MSMLSTYLLALFLIIFCSAFFTRYENKMKKLSRLLLVPTLCGGLLVYLIGYWPDTGIKSQNAMLLDALISLLRAVFSTGRMFVIENDFNDINEILKNNQLYLLAFGTVHVTALLITTIAAISWFGEKILIRLKLLFTSLQTTYIICGLNENSCSFGEDLLETDEKRRVVFIEKDMGSDLPDKAKDLGAIVINSDPLELSCLKHAGINGKLNKRPVYLFTFTEDETLNINIALEVMRGIKDSSVQDKLHIYVRTKAYEIDRVFDDENQKNRTNFDVRIFNETDIAARQLMENHPLHEVVDIDYSSSTAKSDLTVLLAGFGDIGRQVLQKAICCGQFVGNKTRFIIVDNNISKTFGAFKNRYPELICNYDICTVDADVREERFFDLLNGKAGELNYIAVALGQDRLNLDTALGIKAIYDRSPKQHNKQPVIAVNVWDEKELMRCNTAENGMGWGDIRIFGQSKKIFTEDIIINESMDIMAKAVNTYYNNINPQQAAEWRKLSSFTKESNRASAMHIRTKLQLTGLNMCKREMTPDCHEVIETLEKLKEYLGEKRLRNLAMCEHLRWNAFHFASGWRTWKLVEIDGESKPKDAIHKRHACLVDWDALRDVANAFGRDNPEYYQYLDVDQILHIPYVIREAGYTIYIDRGKAITTKNT